MSAPYGFFPHHGPVDVVERQRGLDELFHSLRDSRHASDLELFSCPGQSLNASPQPIGPVDHRRLPGIFDSKYVPFLVGASEEMG